MQLQTREIQGAKDGPHLLITGGVHGDEFEPMAAIRRLMRSVDAAPLRGKLTLVPVVNEAAFWRGSRTAEDELDLARTCPGDPDGSITERTAHALSELIRTADYYIDLHTGGNIMDVWPLVGYGLASAPEVIAVQQRMARAFNLPLVWGTDGRLPGRSLSVARDAGIPAIYAEYMGSGRCDPAGIEAYFAGCLNVMSELGMLNRQQPPSRIKILVEDSRPDSGHMQIRNQSPLNGLFLPQVELGGFIEAGAPLGTVSDVLGENVVTIAAQETGIVICLRTFSCVHEGDALAVILENAESGAVVSGET